MSQANQNPHAEDNEKLLYMGGEEDAAPDAAPAEPAAKDDKPAPEKKDDKDKKDDENKDANPIDLEAMNPGALFEAADDAEEYRSLDMKTEGKPVFSQCCCCICLCHNKRTDGVSCCCVVPIKAGIMAIGVLTIVLAAVQISCQFFLMLNDQVAWWYPLVNLFLLIPTYIAASFFVVWFGKDCVSTRGRLFCGCIMVIVSTSLVAVWSVIYFVWIYKRDTVYYGWGTNEDGYLKFQKKYYIFRELMFAVIIITLWAYFLCVSLRYSNLLKEKRSEDERREYLDDKAYREKANYHLDYPNEKFEKEKFLKEHKAAMDKKEAKRAKEANAAN